MTVRIYGDNRPHRSGSLWVEAKEDHSVFYWVCKEDKFLHVCPVGGCFDTFWYRPGDSIDDNDLLHRCEHYRKSIE